jgi:hypothetical protein
VVELIPREEQQEHLRNKSHCTLHKSHVLIIQIEVIEVDREVVPVVLSDKMVEISLIQEFVAKLKIEESNDCEECGRRD